MPGFTVDIDYRNNLDQARLDQTTQAITKSQEAIAKAAEEAAKRSEDAAKAAAEKAAKFLRDVEHQAKSTAETLKMTPFAQGAVGKALSGEQFENRFSAHQAQFVGLMTAVLKFDQELAGAVASLKIFNTALNAGIEYTRKQEERLIQLNAAYDNFDKSRYKQTREKEFDILKQKQEIDNLFEIGKARLKAASEADKLNDSEYQAALRLQERNKATREAIIESERLAIAYEKLSREAAQYRAGPTGPAAGFVGPTMPFVGPPRPPNKADIALQQLDTAHAKEMLLLLPRMRNEKEKITRLTEGEGKALRESVIQGKERLKVQDEIARLLARTDDVTRKQIEEAKKLASEEKRRLMDLTTRLRMEEQISSLQAKKKLREDPATATQYQQLRQLTIEEAKHEAVLRDKVKWETRLAVLEARRSDGLKNLIHQVKELEAQERRATVATKSLNDSLLGTNQLTAAMRASLTAVGAQFGIYTSGTILAATVTYGFVAAIRDTIIAGAEFEKEMARVGAVMQLSADQMETVKETTLTLAASSRYTATEVMQAFREMGMAGLRYQEAMAGIRAVLSLASIGNMDFSRATDIATNVTYGFNLGMSELTNVVDVMAKTVTNSNQDIEQLGNTMSYAAPVASAFGVSLEFTAAMTEVLANAGIKASRAGTGLRRIFTALFSDSEKVSTQLGELGVYVNSLASDMDAELLRVLKALNVATMGATYQTDNLVKAVGLYAAPAFLKMVAAAKEGVGSLEEIYRATSDVTGAAYDMQKRIEDTLAVDWENFTSSLTAIKQRFFDLYSEDLRLLVKGFTAWTQALSNNQEVILRLANVLEALFTGVKTFVIALGGLAILSGIVKSFSKMGDAAKALSKGVDGAGRAVSGFGKILLGLRIATATTWLGALAGAAWAAYEAFKALSDVTPDEVNQFRSPNLLRAEQALRDDLGFSALNQILPENEAEAVRLYEKKQGIAELEKELKLQNELLASQKTQLDLLKGANDAYREMTSRVSQTEEKQKRLVEALKKASEEYARAQLDLINKEIIETKIASVTIPIDLKVNEAALAEAKRKYEERIKTLGDEVLDDIGDVLYGSKFLGLPALGQAMIDFPARVMETGGDFAGWTMQDPGKDIRAWFDRLASSFDAGAREMREAAEKAAKELERTKELQKANEGKLENLEERREAVKKIVGAPSPAVPEEVLQSYAQNIFAAVAVLTSSYEQLEKVRTSYASNRSVIQTMDDEIKKYAEISEEVISITGKMAQEERKRQILVEQAGGKDDLYGAELDAYKELTKLIDGYSNKVALLQTEQARLAEMVAERAKLEKELTEAGFKEAKRVITFKAEESKADKENLVLAANRLEALKAGADVAREEIDRLKAIHKATGQLTAEQITQQQALGTALAVINGEYEDGLKRVASGQAALFDTYDELVSKGLPTALQRIREEQAAAKPAMDRLKEAQAQYNQAMEQANGLLVANSRYVQNSGAFIYAFENLLSNASDAAKRFGQALEDVVKQQGELIRSSATALAGADSALTAWTRPIEAKGNAFGMADELSEARKELEILQRVASQRDGLGQFLSPELMTMLEAAKARVEALTKSVEDQNGVIEVAIRLSNKWAEAFDAAGMTYYTRTMRRNEELARATSQQEQEAIMARHNAEDWMSHMKAFIDLLRAQGREAEALDLERTLQLNTEDAHIRALLKQKWAIEDLAKAQEKLNQAREEANKLLEAFADYLSASGFEYEAVLIRREIQLEEAKGALRTLLSKTFEAEDRAVGRDLMIQRMKLQGQQMRAINEERKKTLLTLPPMFRALQQENWALEDQAAHRQKLADTLDALGQTQAALRIRNELELKNTIETQRALVKLTQAYADLDRKLQQATQRAESMSGFRDEILEATDAANFMRQQLAADGLLDEAIDGFDVDPIISRVQSVKQQTGDLLAEMDRELSRYSSQFSEATITAFEDLRTEITDIVALIRTELESLQGLVLDLSVLPPPRVQAPGELYVPRSPEREVSTELERRRAVTITLEDSEIERQFASLIERLEASGPRGSTDAVEDLLDLTHGGADQVTAMTRVLEKYGVVVEQTVEQTASLAKEIEKVGVAAKSAPQDDLKEMVEGLERKRDLRQTALQDYINKRKEFMTTAYDSVESQAKAQEQLDRLRARYQETTEAVTGLTSAIQWMVFQQMESNNLLKEEEIYRRGIAPLLEDYQKKLPKDALYKVYSEEEKADPDNFGYQEDRRATLAAVSQEYVALIQLQERETQLQKALANGWILEAKYTLESKKALEEYRDAVANAGSEWDKYRRELERASDVQQVYIQAVDQLSATLVEGAMQGKIAWEDFGRSLLRMLAQLAMNQIFAALIGGVQGWLGGLGGAAPSAAGPNGLPAMNGYSTGGIATGPRSGYPATLHGTEAVVPLPDGRAIPVEWSGRQAAPQINVTVNNSVPNVRTEVRDDGRGGLTIDIVRAALADDAQRGGVPWVSAVSRRARGSR